MVDLSKKFAHYRERLKLAMKSRNLTGERLAELLEAHPVTISKLRNGKLALDDEWRARIAIAFALPEELLFGDADLPEPRPYEVYVSPKKAAKRILRAANENQTLPLYGMAAGSMQGAHTMTSDPVDEVMCPPALVHVLGAYALKTKGESMIPRYFPDDVLYVNPNQRIRSGDHVIVQVALYDNSGTETWVKRFDSEDAENIYVSQYNQPATMKFKKQYVRHMHRVLPVNELFGPA